MKHNDIKYWVEKYILQNINNIDNIDKLKMKNNRNDLDLINIGIPNHNAEDNLGELNIHILVCAVQICLHFCRSRILLTLRKILPIININFS